MRRAPIVVAGTVAGVALVLTFHTSPASLSLAGAPPATPDQTSSASDTAPASASASGSGSTPAPAASQPQTAARTAVGPLVNYSYGVLSVRVTVSGRKITKVSIASLSDGGNPRSQFIDQQAIPVLEQEALQAQSASIQGVSGASFTSAGFTQSLQGALRSLGI